MLELDLSNENVFFVSDTHFNHKKLCSNEEVHFDITRKYRIISEMNDDIINAWNKTVSNNDVVIFMGDFLLSTPNSQIEEVFNDFYNRLNFKSIYWIMGNHDFAIRKKMHIPMYMNAKLNIDGYNFVCQHKDFIEVPELLDIVDEKTYLVHGHTHSDQKTSVVNNYIQNNACWDAWYKPVHYTELIKAI